MSEEQENVDFSRVCLQHSKRFLMISWFFIFFKIWHRFQTFSFRWHLNHTAFYHTRMLITHELMLIIILDYSVLLYCNCHNPFRSYTFMLLFCPQVRGCLLINMHDIYVYVIKVLLFWFCLKNCKLGLLEQTFFLMNLLMKRK